MATGDKRVAVSCALKDKRFWGHRMRVLSLRAHQNQGTQNEGAQFEGTPESGYKERGYQEKGY